MDETAQPAAAAAGAGAAGGVSSLVLPPAFVEDPAGYLTDVASQRPSRRGMASLAGAVAKWFVAAAPQSMMETMMGAASGGGAAAEDEAPHPAVHVSSHYLRAAAVQLQDGINQTAGNVEQEMVKTKHQYEVLEAVGAAATLCTTRAAIFSTGILPTLSQLMAHSQSTAAATSSLVAMAAAAVTGPTLSPPSSSSSSSSYPAIQHAGVEFLQCAILSEQYRFAARLVDGTWPRPNKTVNVKTVLRYYYLRGMVHYGSGDYVMAHRCWWTCLAVPAEACSAVMVAAWKKLSLVQPLLDRSRGVSNAYYGHKSTGAVTTRFPKSMPKAMARLLASGKEDREDNVTLYTQLGPATELGKIEVVTSLIQTFEELLKSDGNYGMAQACLKRVRQNQVWEASQLFSVVSVSQLAKRWKIAPEQVPRRLLEAQVPCRLEDDGMVVFGPDDPLNASDATRNSGAPTGLPQPANRPPANASWTDLSEWMQVLERLQYLDVVISTSSKFQALAKKEEKGGGSSRDPSITGMLPRGVQEF